MSEIVRYNRVGIRIIEVPRKTVTTSPDKPRNIYEPSKDMQSAIYSHNQLHSFNCFYCGCAIADKVEGKYLAQDRTEDHVIPLSSGGKNGFPNVVFCCRSCNAAKRSMSVEWFRANKFDGHAFWGESTDAKF